MAYNGIGGFPYRNAEEAARNAMNWFEFSNSNAIGEMNKWGQDGAGSMRKGIYFALQLMGQPMPNISNMPMTPNNNTNVTPPYKQAVNQEQFPYFMPKYPQVFGYPNINGSSSSVIYVPTEQPLAQIDNKYSEEQLRREEQK